MPDLSLSLRGRTCLVTGATRGLGFALAKELVGMGACVGLVGRSQKRLDDALQTIHQETGSDNLWALKVDLASLDEVRWAAGEICRRTDRLDVLVNNVGAQLLQYQESPDGFEMTWALNYLGHFLLTHLLLDPLKAAAAARGEARVVEVSSTIYRISPASLERLQARQGYNGVQAYAQSKRAMLIFTREMARRLKGSGVTVNAVTPGLVRTHIARQNGLPVRLLMGAINLFGTPLDEGVQPIVHLASAPELGGISGRFYIRQKEAPLDPALDEPSTVRRLWQLSLEQTGIREPV